MSNIRSTFLDFFQNKGHEVVPSSSLVPHNDPTLMFTNAGMVPFKNVFSGLEAIKDIEGNKVNRATSTQKCVRAGGKHNDLDNVGYTARHHTFFEMLGNFSFGDYFKEEAINYAWEFLTKEIGLNKDKLGITVYHTDDEAFEIWKKLTGFSDEKIIRVPTNDNFWSMGATGPCGPCSEIFYDHGEAVDKQAKWGLDKGGYDLFGERFVEIWNLVFMQYDQNIAGEKVPLPKPCIDTGMGLERMAAVIENVHDNYDIELFCNLISASHEFSGNNKPELESSHRIIADHLRSCSFLIADNVRPSNEGRGYVLRRIMRRAMRHAHILGCSEPLMYKLVPTLIDEMGKAFPELTENQGIIQQVMKNEEERFKETLGRGLKLLDEESAEMKKGDELKGKVAFKLYDTYGFPLDLTEDILRARDIKVDIDGFDNAMNQQKNRARAAWSGSGGEATEEIWFEFADKFGATEFLGYQTLKASGEIIAIIKNGEKVEKASKDDEILLLTNQTPFYGESGGQAGDKGVVSSENMKATVTDVKKQLGKLVVHIAKIDDGEIKLGDVISLQVDKVRRDAVRSNHSATHILHATLQKHLGSHVTQKGSLVEAGYLRFDFSHDLAVSAEELRKIDTEVNQIIRNNTEVKTEIMTPDEAKEKGAMALFGEKYGDEVRVLSMGEFDGKNYSMELCGGTHVKRTGDIGLFRITKESSVSAGVRRIEAITGDAALQYSLEQCKYLWDGCSVIKSQPEELADKIVVLQKDQKHLERELSDMKKKIAMGGGTKSSSDSAEQIGDFKFIGKILNDVPAKDLRGIVDDLKKQIGSGTVVIISSNEGKVAIVVGVTDDLTSQLSAVDLVRVGSEVLGGKGGGGRPDFAQAGGQDASKAEVAVSSIKRLISEQAIRIA